MLHPPAEQPLNRAEQRQDPFEQGDETCLFANAMVAGCDGAGAHEPETGI